MAKKKGFRGGKDKGKGAYSRQAGLSRITRANSQSRTRTAGWERYADDEASLEAFETVDRGSNTGEGLLAKFNRLARDTAHHDGIDAEICGFDGTVVMARDDQGREWPCQVRKILKKMLRGVKTPLVVGDAIKLTMLDDNDAVIVAIAERRNQLARADSHNKALEHIFAANIDHLVIVAAMAMPDLKTGLIDRYLTIAHHNDIVPIVVLNKSDLADPTEAAALYRGLGYTVFATSAEQAEGDISPLRDHLRGRCCVMAGQSGVGKSSLINALYPEVAARVGVVSDAQRKGRHTTTASRSYLLADGGRLIDTPGIRECGITGMEALNVALLYPDIAKLHPQCRFNNCTHLHEPDCAVTAALETGGIDPRRYLSYLSIVTEDLGDGNPS
ncbi:MAG: ribosome small subunit-dependent GTPase A [Planctomycetota bacterium]|jgi:ribosome biogenesis GTPase|nr:ribosome small subunit-dependent GTPase A [Planctomycetota bacterium]